ncbi:MAG: CDP-alcohol phosphatidyltransferase family protein [Firmicutes bacterium]|nr:CDP-alcohol phosphatidyltransferase family protein [Bacillota bacterium]HAL63244.1 CDP-diacylglycerol--glycerol-3-phosphate 3-phosphatidyltransferase [Clostridiales bacterium]
MNKLFTKKNILTIPNLLSLLRILMIPIIVWLYISKQNYRAATAVIILSGLTDVADGIIARKFNMVSDFGKILDPIADKLTQGTLIISLSLKYPKMIWLIALFTAKEFIMALLGYITIRNTDSVNSAKWYGKLSTFVLYASMILMVLIPDLPTSIVNTLILLCAAILCLSLFMYTRFYVRILCKG